MVELRLRYLVEDVDRHGNVRLYVRHRGKKKIRIRETFGTPEFLKAYEAALSGITLDADKPARRISNGSFVALCQAYYVSVDFKRLDTSTRNWRKRALDRLCEAEAKSRLPCWSHAIFAGSGMNSRRNLAPPMRGSKR